ncbi:prolyl-tRNA synthetase associated domain-containing protein [Alkaliphilus transvaalensis]|uniref:prolyl-tRNA synthetase associated domain-containing protein n=1 Tax=Alkaliphilus transvaalensis TaxID=114628 RepID=UPI00047D868F|nr:prolyl-tRNA synthetase associated domain-containing protein [Alkaliphilus transvaalensis]
MNKKEQVFKKLDELKIPYEVIYHEAVFTIEEMNDLGISNDGDVVKNLFLRDAKGKRHFLVVMDKDKKADLQSIQQQLGSTVLSFASENRLEKFLQLSKGAVTPLGVINDTKALVEVIFDKELIGKTRLGVHPNDNRATIWISFDNLKTLIEKNGNDIKYITI